MSKELLNLYYSKSCLHDSSTSASSIILVELERLLTEWIGVVFFKVQHGTK